MSAGIELVASKRYVLGLGIGVISLIMAVGGMSLVGAVTTVEVLAGDGTRARYWEAYLVSAIVQCLLGLSLAVALMNQKRFARSLTWAWGLAITLQLAAFVLTSAATGRLLLLALVMSMLSGLLARAVLHLFPNAA